MVNDINYLLSLGFFKLKDKYCRDNVYVRYEDYPHKWKVYIVDSDSSCLRSSSINVGSLSNNLGKCLKEFRVAIINKIDKIIVAVEILDKSGLI